MKKNKKQRMGFQSALLVSWGVIGVSLCGAFLCWWMEVPSLAAFLMAVGVTGLVSRLWGIFALKNVEMTVIADRETLSVGETVTLRYSMQNNKLLPLVWAEVCQDVPARGALVPDESFRLCTFSQEEAEYTGRKDAYMRRFSFFMGWSEITWETVWTGVCRGVYRPDGLLLRSGDGFGLTQSTGEVAGLSGRVLVVWPQIVPVESRLFLRHVWSGSTGKAGWSEDPSVMKGVRTYQPGDPWKRIDWRMAARTDELTIRQFDTVTPLNILFILDGKSLEDPEEGISVLASLILELEHRGVECGLALPATAERAAQVFRPDDPAVGVYQCLYGLAAFSAETATNKFDESAIMTCATGGGQIWLAAGSAGRISCPGLVGRLSGAGVRLLAEEREPGLAVLQEYTFRELLGRGVRP